MSICCYFLYCTKYLKQNNGKCPIQQHDHCKQCNESNSKNNCNCNFKGKMKDLKDHLDRSCNLIPTKQNISLEIVNELNVITKQIRKLQNVVKIQIEQIKNLKAESLRKDQTINAFKKQLEQYQIKFD
ncbi:hypothetical protein RFI_32866 [Reticulomyxa filosa]|uniref:TRAF-type domain-containing protein n=1 Tax=Reticulomyxa filosa TaxID=46433 RepID=X6LT27_RETFI|nr:hypothetical protein RFI_32866 [Reticulomyxa filosa]|eukprot:ETO04531.1 hypothetical protein RFI_32866 [Reticulomyxa filosa]